MEEDQEQTSFTFEIDNFSEKEAAVKSPKFSSGGCEWFVRVHPIGDIVDDHLSLFLFVANPESLRLGWKRRAIYSLVLLNESGKELFKTKESCKLFCAQVPVWGWANAVPLKKLQEKGFLEKNKLIVKVEVKVVEVVDQGDATGNETVDHKGFQILNSQVVSVSRIFTKHPDIAVNFRPKNQLAKTTYMNLLLGLTETLDKPPHSITETELSNAQSDLIQLTDVAGFKLDWLKTKLDEISLARKKANDDGSRVGELEEQIKNLKAELDEEKLESDSSSAKVFSLEQTVSDLKDELNKEKGKSDTYAAKVGSLEQTLSGKKANADGSRVQEFMEQIQNLKAELYKEKLESHTSSGKVLSLEQTVSDLKAELNMEKTKSDTSSAKVLSLEQTVSDLKDELNKEKGKSDTYAAKVVSLDLRAKQNKKRKVSRK